MMHQGSFDDEINTVEIMNQFLQEKVTVMILTNQDCIMKFIYQMQEKMLRKNGKQWFVIQYVKSTKNKDFMDENNVWHWYKYIVWWQGSKWIAAHRGLKKCVNIKWLQSTWLQWEMLNINTYQLIYAMLLLYANKTIRRKIYGTLYRTTMENLSSFRILQS